MGRLSADARVAEQPAENPCAKQTLDRRQLSDYSQPPALASALRRLRSTREAIWQKANLGYDELAFASSRPSERAARRNATATGSATTNSSSAASSSSQQQQSSRRRQQQQPVQQQPTVADGIAQENEHALGPAINDHD